MHVWKGLETRSLSCLLVVGVCYWHLVDKDRGTFYSAQDSSPKRILRPQMSIVPKQRSSDFKENLYGNSYLSVFSIQAVVRLTHVCVAQVHKDTWHVLAFS